jgi:hypothetical protein
MPPNYIITPVNFCTGILYPFPFHERCDLRAKFTNCSKLWF